jgi:hypothetical protein
VDQVKDGLYMVGQNNHANFSFLDNSNKNLSFIFKVKNTNIRKKQYFNLIKLNIAIGLKFKITFSINLILN